MGADGREGTLGRRRLLEAMVRYGLVAGLAALVGDAAIRGATGCPRRGMCRGCPDAGRCGRPARGRSDER